MTGARATSLLGPAIVALAGSVMLRWSWLTWPDPLIDFGRELYVPWRLSEGDVLYRDIVSYFNGPLSPYLHALLFKLFGVSLRTLIYFNLAVVAVLTVMLYALIARAFGRLAATAGTVSFLVLFAFAQHLIGGNYNYVCPYSYELSHGVTLTLGAIVCLDRWDRSDRRLWLAGAGTLLGLVFLTKAEVFLAALVAGGAFVVASLWTRRASAPKTLVTLAILLIASIAPLVLAVMLLVGQRLALAEAIGEVCGAWRWAGDRALLGLPYFRKLAGTYDIGQSISTIVIWGAAYLVLFGIPVVAGLFVRLRPGHWRVAGAVLFVAVLTVGLAGWQSVNWWNFIRAMPLVMAGAVVAVAVRMLRSARLPVSERSTLPLCLALMAWSIAMLARIPLNAHIYHYGFALAMPLTVVGVAVLIGWLPEPIERVEGNGTPLRAVTGAVLLVALFAHARVMHRLWENKTFVVAAGSDAFFADRRGAVVDRMVDEVNRVAPPGATLVVVPEGLIVNYLTRRVNPTGQLNFTPPAIIMYGEESMLGAFRSRPPDFIVLTLLDESEYGARFFGNDYARDLGAWIQQNYELAARVEDPAGPSAGLGGMMLLRRR
jgi:hypothetical protein